MYMQVSYENRRMKPNEVAKQFVKQEQDQPGFTVEFIDKEIGIVIGIAFLSTRHVYLFRMPSLNVPNVEMQPVVFF